MTTLKTNHRTKSFTIESNQEAWNKYNLLMLEQGRPQSSINQYKPVLLKLEETTNKPFDAVTVSEMVEFMEQREGKNINHLNGFYVTCISNSWMKASKDVILHLIPKEYATMIQMLFEK